jgi:ankyrin repeat protein
VQIIACDSSSQSMEIRNVVAEKNSFQMVGVFGDESLACWNTMMAETVEEEEQRKAGKRGVPTPSSMAEETDDDWEFVLGEDQSILSNMPVSVVRRTFHNYVGITLLMKEKEPLASKLTDVAMSDSDSYDISDSTSGITSGDSVDIDGYQHLHDRLSTPHPSANGQLLGIARSRPELTKQTSKNWNMSIRGNVPASTLLKAIRAGDESLALELVERGVNSNARDTWGPALTQALRGGLNKLTRRLIEDNADTDAEDTWGPALTQAIRAGDRGLAKALLQKGANPDARDTWGPALTQAIRAGYEQLAIELLERGANPDAKDTWGPALTQGIRRGQKKLTGMLLRKGASPHVKDTWGPALTQAIRKGDEGLALELIKKGAKPDTEDTWGTALTQARGRGLKNLERKLLESLI